MKLITAHTEEIDDVTLAVSEIMTQLNLDQTLQTHSAGILTCYPEFVESGVVAAICDALPFPIVGCTAPGCGVNGCAGDMILSLAVLTGDDIQFSHASIMVPNEEEMTRNVAQGYHAALQSLPTAPKLMIPFIPQTSRFYNELIFNKLNEVSNETPIFGTFVIDKTANELACHPIYDGSVTPDAVSLLLISGNISPQFYSVSIEKDKIRREKGIVTASDGYFVREVNNIPIMAYLGTIGLNSQESLEGVQSVPFMTDMGDGRKMIARTFLEVNDNGARVKGRIPEGATIVLGEMDFTGLLDTTTAVLSHAQAQPSIHGALVFPCIAREYALGSSALAELKLVESMFCDNVAYHACYSGGELCPIVEEDKTLINQLHNFTFVMCTI